MGTRLNLGESYETFIRNEVDSGKYASDTDVICGALRFMQDEKQRLAYLGELISVGDEQIKRGEVQDFTPELRKRITQQAIQNSKAGKLVKDGTMPIGIG